MSVTVLLKGAPSQPSHTATQLLSLTEEGRGAQDRQSHGIGWGKEAQAEAF